MRREDYVETVVVKGRMVNIGIDDYGQCYFFEFVDSNGELKEVGCGTYNSEYLEEVYGYFDHKGTFISLYGKELWDADTENIKKRMQMHPDDAEFYQQILKSRETEDFGIYDFDAMYKERELKY